MQSLLVENENLYHTTIGVYIKCVFVRVYNVKSAIFEQEKTWVSLESTFAR